MFKGSYSFLVGGWTTQLKNMSQNGSFPLISGWKYKGIWKHHLVLISIVDGHKDPAPSDISQIWRVGILRWECSSTSTSTATKNYNHKYKSKYVYKYIMIFPPGENCPRIARKKQSRKCRFHLHKKKHIWVFPLHFGHFLKSKKSQKPCHLKNDKDVFRGKRMKLAILLVTCLVQFLPLVKDSNQPTENTPN